MKLNLSKKVLGACAVLLAALALGVTPACSSTEEDSNANTEGVPTNELDRQI